MKKLIIKLSANLFIAIFLLILFLSHPSFSFADDPLTPWITTTSLPITVASHTSEVYNNKIFIFGGGNTEVNLNTYSTNVNADGTLGNWNTSIPSPKIFWHSSAIKDNHIYLLGGAILPVASINTVYMGTIDSTGSITSWQTLNPLPQTLSLGGSVINGNKIYYVGGFLNGGDTYANVYMANINSDGTIGEWSEINPLPKPINGFGLVTDGNNLIALGGKDTYGNYSSAIYEATFNQDGTLSEWTQIGDLPEPTYRSSVILTNTNPEVLIVAGGADNNVFLDKVYYAIVNQDGSLGQWNLSNYHLPQPLAGGAITFSGNNLYILGGFADTYLNTVYYTKLNLSLILHSISFEDVLRDIHNAYLNKQIDNGIDVALAAYIKSSQRSYERGDKATSLLDLNNFIRQLNKFNGTKIDPAAFSLLSSDASGLQTLINSL